MANPPNYSFHRKPRLSANQVADYIATDTAAQRKAVIRSAKFPRKLQVVPYSEARRIIRAFLTSNKGDVSSLDDHIARLDIRHRSEPDGWMRGEINRNISALKAFKQSLTTTKLKRLKFVAGPADHAMILEEVRVNIRLDPALTETDDAGVTYSGGCVTFLANTDASRRKIEERRKTVAALVHWALKELEESGGNIVTLERLCLSYDIFGGVIISAPKSIDRLRANIRASCGEAAELWDGVKPPPDYDGPAWQ